MYNEDKLEPHRAKGNTNDAKVNELKTNKPFKIDNARLKTEIIEKDFPPEVTRKIRDLPTRSTTQIKSFRNSIGSTSTRKNILSRTQYGGESMSRKQLYFNSRLVNENQLPTMKLESITIKDKSFLSTINNMTTKANYQLKSVTNRNIKIRISNVSTTATSKGYKSLSDIISQRFFLTKRITLNNFINIPSVYLGKYSKFCTQIYYPNVNICFNPRHLVCVR